MRNLRPGEFGAVNPEWFATPFNFTLDWPYPILERGENVSLLLKRTTASTLSTSWAETAITPKRSTATGTNATITEGGVWHSATFEDVWFATNGVTMLLKIPTYTPVLVADGLTVGTLCAVDDRLVMADVSGAWFSGSRWLSLMDTWRRTRPKFSHDQMIWSRRMVIWGEQRGGAHDTPFWPLLVAMGVFGEAAFDAMQSKFITCIENGEIGFSSVRSLGTPVAMKSLSSDGGDFVVVYSTEGRVFLRRNENDADYELVKTEESGVVNRGGLSGGSAAHVWIAPSRKIHAQAAGSPVRELRHEHRITGSLAKLVASYDKDTKEHWLATENWAYVVNRFGVGGPMDVRPTSLARADGVLVGAGYIPSGQTVPVEFYTHKHNMGFNGSKKINVVEVESAGLLNIDIDVEASAATEAPYSIGTVQANEMNVGFPGRSGNVFQVGIKADGVLGGSYAITSETIRYQSEDRRFRRGATAAADNG